MFGVGTDVSRDNPANDYSKTTKFKALQYKQTIHYKSNYNFMAGAIVTTIICVLFVLPVYWGFWQLGRK
jgi:hypothetical protein